MDLRPLSWIYASKSTAMTSKEWNQGCMLQVSDASLYDKFV